MAIGSRRTTPTRPVMAAVVSVLIAEPRKTPCVQSKASNTSGITFVRREPKMKPEIGTPCGSSQFGATEGRSEEHTSELQSRLHLVCRLLLEKKKKTRKNS